jgi:N-methylhydantoinase A
MTTEGKVGGLPLTLRQIDINSIGVGGGSIASHQGGFLSVGPRSAGAMPGPACYGRGGLDPTITDANVVLGRLGVDRPLGGEIALDRKAAIAAMTPLSAELALSTAAMAEGILRLATVSLAGAIKEVSVMRGIDPRDFALFAFGGAGPLHAAAIADELGMQTVVIPPMPGNFSALGLLLADVRRDFVRTRVCPTADLQVSDVRATLRELVQQGEAELADFPPERRRYAASLDMRYLGQSFELSVPVSLEVEEIAIVERNFNDVYAARYGAATKRPIEIVSYRLAAFGLIDKPELPAMDAAARKLICARTGARGAIFDGIEHQVPVFDRELLPAGESLQGPVLIEELSSTTVIPQGWSARLDRLGGLVVSRG